MCMEGQGISMIIIDTAPGLRDECAIDRLGHDA
jgi:hypothetical protein